MKNNCDVCKKGFGLFNISKVKCKNKGCENAICYDCYKKIKEFAGKDDMIKICPHCKLTYCDTHFHKHGCLEIVPEPDKMQQQEDFQEFEDKEVKKAEEESSESDDNRAIFSPKKTLIALSPKNIKEQLEDMEECEEEGYVLIVQTINQPIILYRKETKKE